MTAIAGFGEGVLLDTGFADEAYAHYVVAATYATTNLATFKAVLKKYSPTVSRETILRYLVASQPGKEGKWFAATKDAGSSGWPLNWRIETRETTDADTGHQRLCGGTTGVCISGRHESAPLHCESVGYDITDIDVLDAYSAVMAADAAGVNDTAVKTDVRAIIAASRGGEFVRRMLGWQLQR